jgi:hypothetical protein
LQIAYVPGFRWSLLPLSSTPNVKAADTSETSVLSTELQTLHLNTDRPEKGSITGTKERISQYGVGLPFDNSAQGGALIYIVRASQRIHWCTLQHKCVVKLSALTATVIVLTCWYMCCAVRITYNCVKGKAYKTDGHYVLTRGVSEINCP